MPHVIPKTRVKTMAGKQRDSTDDSFRPEGKGVATKVTSGQYKIPCGEGSNWFKVLFYEEYFWLLGYNKSARLSSHGFWGLVKL